MKLFVALVLGLGAAAVDAATPPPQFDCMIEPIQIIEVRSPVVGVIEAIHVHRGDLVHQGDRLVTIESSVERSARDSARYKSRATGALKLAQSKLAATTKKAKRNQELYEEEFVSAQARDDAEAERKLAKAEVQQARENLEIARLDYRQAVDQMNRRVLHSSITGVVMDQYQYPGSVVDAGEGKKPILKLAENSTLRVEAIMRLSHYEEIKPGTPATIWPEPPLGGNYAAVVKTIDRVVDSASGTFGVVIELNNAAQKIPAGVRCKVSFDSIR